MSDRVRDRLGLGEKDGTEPQDLGSQAGPTAASPSAGASEGSAAPSDHPDHPHQLLPVDSIIAQCEGALTGLDAVGTNLEALKAQVQGILIAAVDLRLRTMGGMVDREKAAVRARMDQARKAKGPETESAPEREDAPGMEQGPNNHTSPSPEPDQPGEGNSPGTGPISVPNDCPHETIADVSTMGGGTKWHCFDCDTEIEV